MITSAYYDESKELILIPQKGYAVVDKHYNERGLLEWEAYYDEVNKPICRTDYKVAKI